MPSKQSSIYYKNLSYKILCYSFRHLLTLNKNTIFFGDINSNHDNVVSDLKQNQNQICKAKSGLSEIKHF